jgi:PhzF family phenazine biosynthesis protein
LRFPFFQLDAFEEGPFTGNPAAVCVLPEDVGAAAMLGIARENNLSETAFLLAEGDRWRIRWFTPGAEVDLCGHATLAAGAVVMERLSPGTAEVWFESRSGPLGAARSGGGIMLDFPAWPATPAAPDAARSVAAALGSDPVAVLEGPYTMAVYDDPAAVEAVTPDFEALRALPAPGVIVTAPAASVDFVSRFFAPGLGVPEDPVTGSAHCMLAPWWSARLGKNRLVARQVSARGGRLECETRGDRVRISGRARFVIEGHYEL